MKPGEVGIVASPFCHEGREYYLGEEYLIVKGGPICHIRDAQWETHLVSRDVLEEHLRPKGIPSWVEVGRRFTLTKGNDFFAKGSEAVITKLLWPGMFASIVGKEGKDYQPLFLWTALGHLRPTVRSKTIYDLVVEE